LNLTHRLGLHAKFRYWEMTGNGYYQAELINKYLTFFIQVLF